MSTTSRKWIAGLTGVVVVGVALAWWRTPDADAEELARLVPTFNEQVKEFDDLRSQAKDVASRCEIITGSRVTCNPVSQAYKDAAAFDVKVIDLDSVNDGSKTLVALKNDQVRIKEISEDLRDGMDKAQHSVDVKSGFFKAEVAKEVERTEAYLDEAKAAVESSAGAESGLIALTQNEINHVEKVIASIGKRGEALNAADDQGLLDDLTVSKDNLREATRKLRNGIAALSINPGAPQALDPDDALDN
ncbi:hypothetical protein [Arcanobacterium buesumense]|uniref:Uncharacterized protein n=1 Tax=Arcanobacterium buesumense TaxID=2722751 RepID=A0A6H2EN62_9ACTO|nr:hypothetical protein [Arcanobacterium buesumense]QJC22518.1 hypothetical protein HC352_08385 [Arcanobacterium buesumense]